MRPGTYFGVVIICADAGVCVCVYVCTQVYMSMGVSDYQAYQVNMTQPGLRIWLQSENQDFNLSFFSCV